MLRNAAALGTLLRIDPVRRLAEFRIRCAWHFAPKKKIRPGIWQVSLTGLSFEFETYPNGPASGISHDEALGRWERDAMQFGWVGTIYLTKIPHPMPRNGYLTDGPATDICGGILG